MMKWIDDAYNENAVEKWKNFPVNKETSLFTISNQVLLVAKDEGKYYDIILDRKEDSNSQFSDEQNGCKMKGPEVILSIPKNKVWENVLLWGDGQLHFWPTQRTKQCLSPLIVRNYARIFVRLEMSGGPRGQEFNIRKCRHTIGLNNYR